MPVKTSWTFSQRVRAAGLAHSLGTIGDAFDNTMVESFWARMKFNRRKGVSIQPPLTRA
jgi:transposase InsO family protein